MECLGRPSADVQLGREELGLSNLYGCFPSKGATPPFHVSLNGHLIDQSL